VTQIGSGAMSLTVQLDLGLARSTGPDDGTKWCCGPSGGSTRTGWRTERRAGDTGGSGTMTDDAGTGANGTNNSQPTGGGTPNRPDEIKLFAQMYR